MTKLGVFKGKIRNLKFLGIPHVQSSRVNGDMAKAKSCLLEVYAKIQDILKLFAQTWGGGGNRKYFHTGNQVRNLLVYS